MKRALVAVAALVLLAVSVLSWSLTYNLSTLDDGVFEPTSITSYDAMFDVAEDGSMSVVETIVVDVTAYDRHGIFRFFDRADPNAPHVRREPRDLKVEQDGEPVPVDISTRDQGRFYVARIGDPDLILSYGPHTYRIEYVVDDVLIEDPDSGGSRFYWQLIPGGWAQQIGQARLTVVLPATTSDVECAVGATATTGCNAAGEGTSNLSVLLGALPAFTPVTVRADVAQPVPPAVGRTYPWAAQYDAVLGGSVPAVVLVVLLGLLAAAVGARASRRAHEPPPGFPLQYAPPPGVGPAQAAYVLDERIGREQFVATVLHAAQQGVVTLEHTEHEWTLRESGERSWQDVDSVTGGLATLVGGQQRGFTASPSSTKAGKKLQQHLAAFESGTREWALRERLMVTGPVGGAGGVVVGVAYALALVLGFWNPFGFALLAIVPGLFAIGGLGLLAPGAATLRTASGRDLWSRAGGFRRVLSTPSSKERFDFSGRQELYTAYVPWAVAFGCADAWAAKYRTETGTEPPVPAYFGSGYVGAHTATHVDQMIADFDSTVSSAISSYQATQQSSSSSGGGGFSGGGGGGGGGGGSW